MVPPPPSGFERSVVPGCDLDDLDQEALEAFVKQRAPTFAETIPLERLATQLGLYAPLGSKLLPTAVGLLCFGHLPQLTRPEWGIAAVRVDGRRLADPLVSREELQGPLRSLLSGALSFVEEHESITGLLTRLGDGGDLADAAATLGLDPYVTKLRQLNAAFGPELERPDRPAAPTWDQIRAARARHQHAVLVYVAAVLGAHLGDDASDVDARAALLGPVMAQQQALAALYRNRRGGRDVDPVTGTEEDTASLPNAG